MPQSRQAVYSSFEDAFEEAERVKSEESSGGLVTKVENSPYGSGFVVRSFPASLLRRRLMRPKNRSVEYRTL